MNNIQIIFPIGEYSNGDAYEAILTYVTSKLYPSGYGIPIPVTRDNSIIYFYKAQANSNQQSARYLWHFTINFKEKRKDLTQIMLMGQQIAYLFSSAYQVVYGLDLGTDHTHLHFAVNAYSYHPDAPVLSNELMEVYVQQMEQIIKFNYPYYQVKPRDKNNQLTTGKRGY